MRAEPESGTCSTRRRTHSRSVVAMTFVHGGLTGARRGDVTPSGRARLSSRYPDGGKVSRDTSQPPRPRKGRAHTALFGIVHHIRVLMIVRIEVIVTQVWLC